MKQVAGKIKLELAQYREMASFSQFASDLDSSSKKLIARGERLTELLKQSQYAPMNIEDQVVSIFLGVRGFLDEISVKQVRKFEKYVLERIKKEYSNILSNIREAGKISDEIEEELKKIVEIYQADFLKEQKD